MNYIDDDFLLYYEDRFLIYNILNNLNYNNFNENLKTINEIIKKNSISYISCYFHQIKEICNLKQINLDIYIDFTLKIFGNYENRLIDNILINNFIFFLNFNYKRPFGYFLGKLINKNFYNLEISLNIIRLTYNYFCIEKPNFENILIFLSFFLNINLYLKKNQSEFYYLIIQNIIILFNFFHTKQSKLCLKEFNNFINNNELIKPNKYYLIIKNDLIEELKLLKNLNIIFYPSIFDTSILLCYNCNLLCSSIFFNSIQCINYLMNEKFLNYFPNDLFNFNYKFYLGFQINYKNFYLNEEFIYSILKFKRNEFYLLIPNNYLIFNEPLIHLSIKLNNFEFLEILLNKDNNEINNIFEGDYPIHIACRYGSLECLIILIKFYKKLSLNLFQLNFSGINFIQIILKFKFLDLIIFLKKFFNKNLFENYNYYLNEFEKKNNYLNLLNKIINF